MGIIRTTDKASLGVIIGSTITSAAIGYAKTRSLKRTPVTYSRWFDVYYLIILTAGLYQLVRIIGPKTKQERQAEKMQQA